MKQRKRTLNELPRLNVSELYKRYGNLAGLTLPAPIDKVVINGFYETTRFRCAGCDKHARTLYNTDDRWICKRCTGLLYHSEWISKRIYDLKKQATRTRRKDPNK